MLIENFLKEYATDFTPQIQFNLLLMERGFGRRENTGTGTSFLTYLFVLCWKDTTCTDAFFPPEQAELSLADARWIEQLLETFTGHIRHGDNQEQAETVITQPHRDHIHIYKKILYKDHIYIYIYIIQRSYLYIYKYIIQWSYLYIYIKQRSYLYIKQRSYLYIYIIQRSYLYIYILSKGHIYIYKYIIQRSYLYIYYIKIILIHLYILNKDHIKIYIIQRSCLYIYILYEDHIYI